MIPWYLLSSSSSDDFAALQMTSLLFVDFAALRWLRCSSDDFAALRWLRCSSLTLLLFRWLRCFKNLSKTCTNYTLYEVCLLVVESLAYALILFYYSSSDDFADFAALRWLRCSSLTSLLFRWLRCFKKLSKTCTNYTLYDGYLLVVAALGWLRCSSDDFAALQMTLLLLDDFAALQMTSLLFADFAALPMTLLLFRGLHDVL